VCPQETPLSLPDLTRLTRRQAEKVAGVSRATLARYVADGKLSAGKDNQGYNTYDAAELQRVFPDTFDLRRLETPDTRDGVSPSDTGQDTLRDTRDTTALATLTVEKRYLTEERDRLREEAERLRRELADERRKREEERVEFVSLLRQNQEMVKQLTDQRAKEVEAPRGFWRRLRGG
jgi:predicted ribosome quality control (RQC) complex YloA/Tae2 family protein